MSKDTPQNHIAAVKKVLDRVSGYSWPDDVRAALQDAQQRLAQLNAYVEANTEESRLADLGRKSLALGASLNLNEVLTQVMDTVIDLTHAERGFLMLLEPQTGELKPYAARNIERATLEQKDMEYSRTLIQGVIQSGVGVLTTDAQNDPRFAAQASVVLYNLRSVMCAPLRARQQVIGVIYVDNRARSGLFTDVDLKLLNIFASQAAAAIENARLYAQADQTLAVQLAENQRLFQALQESIQSKTKFVSTVTHELRVPMTSIKGYADLMRQGAVGPVNEMQVSFLNVVRNNVERMSALISDLSDLSRIESGRLALSLEMFSPGDKILEVLNAWRARWDEKQQLFELHLPEGLPQVYADALRVGQVLNNLLSNAHRYTPQRGKISVQLSLEGGFVRLEVSDTGIGISPEDQANLFNPFFRAEDTEVREQPGWGLALSVSKGLVEAMGGKIGYSSALKQGSAFWFTLPTSAP